MATVPYGEWSKKEQTEFENIHNDYLARLAADKAVKAKYAAISEGYKKTHLAHIKQYSSTASSRRSTL